MPRFVWTRTAWDFTAARWHGRASALATANRQLEAQVLTARRDPTQSERERNDYAGFSERLSRCIAFGQFAEEVDPQRQRLAQMGLLGTSAAFQVLSLSAQAVNFQPGAKHLSDNETRWLDAYLRCLNFLDLVVDPAGAEPAGELWRQRRLTLRICLMMRAMAAASPVLDKLNRLSLSAAHQEIIEDLSQPLDQIARHHVNLLSQLLAKCLVAAGDVEQGWKGGGSAIENTYAFAATSRDGPTTPDEWVFMWATAIASSVRCWRRGLLPDEFRLRELCPIEDIAPFIRVLHDPPENPDGAENLDRRFKLFGLWALNHLDVGEESHVAPDETALPEHLRLSEENRGWLQAEVKTTVTSLMAREVSLVDSWQPYSTYMGGLGPDGALGSATDEASPKPDLSDYRDDVMVVPVVPLIFTLVSRYDRATLCRRSTMLTLRASIDKDHRRDVGRAKPYQLGNRDGVVNLSYWQEAYKATGDASSTMADERVKRWLWLLKATIRDNGRRATLAGIIAATVVAYVAFVASEGVVSGVLFGVLASVLAAVVSPGLVKYLWGHKDL